MAKQLYFELSTAMVDGREFDGMAEGSFVDMMGREVNLNGAEFAQFAANTQDAILATRTDSGEVVGLPIDAQGHDNGDGAGWIVAVKHIKRDGLNLIRFVPKWTAIGRELISGGIRRMFSPTVDLTNKVILGGSLTNWPASRTKKGRNLLRPIELSQGVETMEENEVVENVETTAPAVETPDLPPAPPVVNLEALLSHESIGLQVRELIRQGVSAELSRIHAENEIGAFVAQLSGLPVKADEVTAFLLELAEPQRIKARAILDACNKAAGVGFTERGHAGVLEGKAQLSAPMKAVLKTHIAEGGTVESFFEWNQAELGVKSDYDLAEFEAKEE